MHMFSHAHPTRVPFPGNGCTQNLVIVSSSIISSSHLGPGTRSLGDTRQISASGNTTANRHTRGRSIASRTRATRTARHGRDLCTTRRIPPACATSYQLNNNSNSFCLRPFNICAGASNRRRCRRTSLLTSVLTLECVVVYVVAWRHRPASAIRLAMVLEKQTCQRCEAPHCACERGGARHKHHGQQAIPPRRRRRAYRRGEMLPG